jgi:rsbT co-antagonist protein RsbR
MTVMPTSNGQSRLPQILILDQKIILEAWMGEQLAAIDRRMDLISEADLREQSKTLLAELTTATQTGSLSEISGSAWASVRGLLAEYAKARTSRGFTAAETTMFVLSLRSVLMKRLQASYGSDATDLASDMGTANLLLDKLGLVPIQAVLEIREQTIKRQMEEMLELSTPVVRLFPGILGLPLVGTLDSARTQVVMESLLQQIVETESSIAILDITGVPTVDTLVAQHLLKTVAAARLMGADCIISGIRPQIAQTIVHLGVDLQNVSTKASLADALALALQRLGLTVQKIKEAPRQPAKEK